MSDKKIVVVGLGYVGLSISVLLAQKNEVYAVDILENRVESINNRKSPIVDNLIEEYLANNQLNLTATTNGKQYYKSADYIIIATPTNYDDETHFFNTSSVETVINDIIETNTEASIIIKSTIPVGYTKKIQKKFNYKNIFFSPEFLREGKALFDNLYPSRIIVGCDKDSNDSVNRANIFLNLMRESAVKKDIPVFLTNSTEAEAIKLFANTYLALRVAFFNELDTYAETRKLSTQDIIQGVCADPRIGDFYNNPSFGYGGYCLPKDTKQLLANYGRIPENLIQAVVDSNRTRKDYIADHIISLAEKLEKENIVVGIYRLTMKTSSDNFRQSAILGIIKRLEKTNIDIIIYEPQAEEDYFLGHKIIKDLSLFKENSDIIVANRFSDQLSDVKKKVYTRDVYRRD